MDDFGNKNLVTLCRNVVIVIVPVARSAAARLVAVLGWLLLAIVAGAVVVVDAVVSLSVALY